MGHVHGNGGTDTATVDVQIDPVPADNIFYGTNKKDNFQGSHGIDLAFGSGGNDQLHGGGNNDILLGESGNDRLIGQDGDDLMFGGVGDDKLIGGFGNDILIGGTGDDEMIGNEDDDTFVFETGFGNDTVKTFVAGAGTDDVLEFRGFGASLDFATIIAGATQSGNTTVLNITATDTIEMKNVNLADLHQDDFDFI